MATTTYRLMVTVHFDEDSIDPNAVEAALTEIGERAALEFARKGDCDVTYFTDEDELDNAPTGASEGG